MKKPATKAEKLFMSLVKLQQCIICCEPPISYCHHIVSGYRLGNMFCLPLCYNCHQGDDGFTGKNRKAWDKSLSNQLKLLEVVCAKMNIEPPEYKTKVVKRKL